MINLYQYDFIQQLTHLPFIDALWLYGSRARKDNSNRSDIDLAILCPRATKEDWQLVGHIIEQADTLLKIDYVRFDDLADDAFKKNILKFKKIIFERHGGYMEKEFWRDYFDSLGKALNRLHEMIVHPELDTIDYLQDATIQRFEFCIELYWKVLKKFLAYEKIDAVTPREVLQKAFQFELIDDEKAWLQMMDDRNKTSHVYKEDEAKKVFQNIKVYYPVMEKTYKKLSQRYYSYDNSF